jgi:hypothetical protein
VAVAVVQLQQLDTLLLVAQAVADVVAQGIPIMLLVEPQTLVAVAVGALLAQRLHLQEKLVALES